MKRVCVLVVVSGCTITKPAEYSAQDYVLMGTPTYEYRVGEPSEPIVTEMIAAMLPSVKVGLVAQTEEEGDLWRGILSDFGVSAGDLDNLVVFPIEHTDIWFRDMGGIFVHGDIAGYDTLAVIDQEFDGWGYGPQQDDLARELYAIDNLVAGQLGAQMDIPVIDSPLIFEGGGIASNGKGTVVYSLPALTQRNPGWTQPQFEAELTRVLGADNLLPMPVFHPTDGNSVIDGPLELDGRFLHYPFTVRHVDEIMAFVDEETILVVQFPQDAVTNWIEQEIHDRLEEAWDFLAAQTDQDGNPFELVAFPDPGLLTETLTADDAVWQGLGTMTDLQNYDPAGGEIVVPANYINYVITNDLVLVPFYYREGRDPRIMQTDAEAKRTLELLFPDREVMQLDPYNVTVGGGGMHCITQEVVGLPSRHRR